MERKTKNKNGEIFCQFIGKKKYPSNEWIIYGYREYKSKLQAFCI